MNVAATPKCSVMKGCAEMAQRAATTVRHAVTRCSSVRAVYLRCEMFQVRPRITGLTSILRCESEMLHILNKQKKNFDKNYEKKDWLIFY